MTNTLVRLLILVTVYAFYVSFKSCECQAQTGNVVSLSTLMDEMVSAESDVCFPVPFYSARQLTSYDRRSLIPGTTLWHANDDWSGYIRLETNNGRQEKVLFDEKGPGVLTRIITTGGSGTANLRIYFDDEAEASIKIQGYDISKFPVTIPAGMIYMHEHYNTSQGCSFYYPIPYSKRCKITVDDVNRAAYVYHVNYRSYEEGTVVKTFTIDDANALEDKAVEIGNKLQNPENYTSGEFSISKELGPGDSLSLDLPAGEKAVRTLNFNISGYDKASYDQLMRGLIVKITFDSTQTVWAPLSDFSGAGMGAPKVDSYYLSADGAGNVTIRFVMPYKKNAKVELENITKYTATASIKANVSDWTWQTNTLYFHATWRQERSLKTNIGLDYNNATLTGRGVFKGDVLSLYNYIPRWYGEGDEHIWVDNESFPSHFGCGTEDYYNTTYAPIHVYFNPFGGAPREDNESSHGYNTFVRTRNLDVIPFNNKLKFDFELISWDGGLVDYASTVYWYGDIHSIALNPSSNEEALQPLPRSNSVKVEAESGTVNGGAVKANYGSASGGVQVGNLDNVGANFQVTVNLAKAGLKTIAIIYSNGMGNTRYKSLYINGVKIRQLSFKPTANWSTYSILNTNVTFEAGTNTIKIQRDATDNIATDVDYILVPAETAIDVTGDLTFGNIAKDSGSVKILTIRNTGSVPISISKIIVPEGFSANLTDVEIAEDAEQEVIITFTPTETKKYSGIIKVISNAKAGIDTISVSGTGDIIDALNKIKETKIKLYPNPVKNKLTLTVGNFDNLEISDVSGKIIIKKK
ncbi:MAG: DUF2961 domain-containing protein [Salinivirgaceae bacterium]|jgi:hypothetical protein|nr:DUF2961 domain-containing protein [Salinivirgaceae bacterium]